MNIQEIIDDYEINDDDIRWCEEVGNLEQLLEEINYLEDDIPPMEIN